MNRHVSLVPATASTDCPDHVADRAARRAGVRVAGLQDVQALDGAAELFRAVWRTDTRPPPVTRDLLRAMTHAGGYVAGAYDGDVLVGASMALLSGGPADVHSHITGVLPSVQGRGVGVALKLHQRAWALERGLRTVSWTFDPLLRRNAWLNLARLGATVVDYLVDFYGPMDDEQNSGDASDRVVTVWDLDAARTRELAAGLPVDPRLPHGGVVRLRVGATGEPETVEPETFELETFARGSGRSLLVQVPDDAQRLRQERPDLACAWRHAVRDVLAPLLSGGWSATTITRDGWYLLEESS